jgi:GT2 family glycosyltransferase/glycosyltransferase involved in cell wall biosynthesis
LIGGIDRIDHDEISGWAWNPDHPGQAVDVEILDDDVVVLKVSADQFRPDVVQAGVGSGRHGFLVRGLGGVFPLSHHRVRVRRAIDGRDLPGSPAWINRPAIDDRAMDFIQQVVFSAVETARGSDDLAEPLGLLLRLLNDVVNTQAGLARTEHDPRFPSAIEAATDQPLTDQMQALVSRLQYAHAPLHFEPPAEPEVSVIIPVHNKFSYTYDCLRSIHEKRPKVPFEIILVDDCSSDETLLCALVFSGAVRIVRNSSNLGFVRTCNAGAAVARGKYLFFLNNDTLVRDGWLDRLVETFEQVPNVGIAGSKLLFENGRLQEAGGIIWRLGDGWSWGRDRDPNEPAFCFLRDADWVCGAALMIRRTTFEELGGFDELFAPGYYEDTDLSFRVRARGQRVVVQPASEIVHLEGVTSGTDTSGPGMKRFQVINQAKFYQRWKDTLITHRLNGEHPELEAERLVRRRAYFIDDSVPTPDQDAGSNAALEHMRALLDLGYKVTFLAADNMAKIDPYTAHLQKIGIECLYYPFFWSVEEVFRKAAHRPDLVYLHRFSNATRYATMVRRYFPDARIVYSVADLHFLRMERQAELEPGTISVAQLAQQRHSEMAAIESVDCVIVHSPVEAALLREVDPSLNVKVVQWTVRPRPTMRPFAERSGAAFVGRFDHPPNADAVHYLVSDILPLLREHAPDCMTYIVGSHAPAEIMNLQVPGVTTVGFVPVLADVLHKLRCTVVPLRYGAGIKGKVLESLAHGLPCVMSEVAAEGLELPADLAWLVARSPAEFAEKLARMQKDAAFNRRLSEAGLAYIEQWHSAEAVKEALRTAVDLAHHASREQLNADADAFAPDLAFARAEEPPAAPPGEEAANETSAQRLFRQKADILRLSCRERKLDFACPDQAEISVLMVLHNQFPLTLMALGSLRATFAGAIELILVDSGSTDETRHIERYVMGAQVLRFDSNIGYLRGCNAALQLSSADVVLYLNNDIELAPDAVGTALRRLRSQVGVGAVGGKVVRCHGLLQEAGCTVWRDGSTSGYLRGQSPAVPEANFVRRVDFCSGVFLMVRGEVVRQLDGFDDRFAPAYYEDADLCIRIAQAGYDVLYDPSVIVFHHEYGSAESADAPVVQMERNRGIFLRKHAAYLQDRPVWDDRRQALARFAETRATRVLFIEDTVPLRTIGSGFVRSNDLIQEMASLGHQLTVFPLNGSHFDVANVCRDIPETVEVMHDKSIDSLVEFLGQREDCFDAVWIARTHNLDRIRPFLDPILAGTNPPFIVLDTEAIEATREAKRLALAGEPAADLEAEVRSELRHADICRTIVAVSEEEAAILRTLGWDNVEVIGHIRTLAPTPKPFAERTGLLFVGAMHREASPNYDSLDWFVTEVLPIVEQTLGWQTRLTVVGYTAPDVSLARFAGHPRVTLRGAVEDIESAYDQHRVFVAPTRYAAGQPYKVFEAASFGLPVVATELLRRQMNWESGQDLLAAEDGRPERFAQQIIALYQNEALWQRIRAGALERLRRENSRDRYVEAIGRVLGPADCGG